MTSIASKTKEKNYEVEIKSASGHTVFADEPTNLGGQNKGMEPTEFLIAGLAACTSATLKMYAQRKKWDLQAVNTNIELIKSEKSGELPSIINKVELIGNLDEKQRERLMVIANKCPVNRMLSGGLKIESKEVDSLD